MMQRDQQLQQTGVAVNAPPAQPDNTAESSAPPPADTAETTTSQPASVTVNYFYDTLTPYGGWVDVDRLRLVLAANDRRLQQRLATVLR